MPEEEFWKKSALGASLRRVAFDITIKTQIAFENEQSLADVYNQALAQASEAQTLLFIHDDIWLDDCYFSGRIAEGLRNFDIIGVVGNKRRLPRQAHWLFPNGPSNREQDPNTLDLQPDSDEYLAGLVAHGQLPFGRIAFFGPSPAPCELLDGVFLAAQAQTLKKAAVQFDPRFKTHFLDMDFCRAARQKELRLGVWPISLTQQSKGHFVGPEWTSAYWDYVDKWGD